MFEQTIITDDIENGLDRKMLHNLRQRFLLLNEKRLERTRAALVDRQQQFLTLLPLLFHINHPILPGYVSHKTPCGIYQYTPSGDAWRQAKVLSRSVQPVKDLRAPLPALDALFVMGSMGTIAHSDSSDLDIWICHQPGLTGEELAELRKKCDLLSEWAGQQLHLEVHFFLMTENSFKSGETASLSKENSGSAQHFLLLDEFYRTAIWLAGKVPLWWFVPAARETTYEAFTERLLSLRFINPQDVIDFGSLAKIPENEFVGAGIWHLYKAIDAPYKSVLKLLLLESYVSAREQPPLAIAFKQAVYDALPDADALDPYVMIYRHLENYLQTNPVRLQLLRRCFYAKVNKPLTRSANNESWQRQLLQQLVQEWQWEKHHLFVQDGRDQWKAADVLSERSLLVNELANSYRLISGVSKSTMMQAAISHEELAVLGRKLHAAFERKAGKIEWINPGISRDLEEPVLTLLRSEGSEPQHWLLFTGPQQDIQQRLIYKEPIKRARHLVELILWAYCNQILTANTRLDIIDEATWLTPVQRQQLLGTLSSWLPLPLSTPAHDAFRQQAQPERLLLLLNVGIEPQPELFKKGIHLLSERQDALDYSGLHDNLVVSADIIYTNSWHEVICRHFDKDALVNLLSWCLRLRTTTGKLPEISIHCFSSGLGQLIARRMDMLWQDIVTAFYTTEGNSNARYIIETAEGYLLLQAGTQPEVHALKNEEQLLQKLAEPQAVHSPLLIDRNALTEHPLRLITRIAKTADIYLFYRIDADTMTARIFLVDERGSILSYQVPFHNNVSLVKPLQQFILSTMQRMAASCTIFQQQKSKLFIFELSAAGKPGVSHPDATLLSSTSAADPLFINIQVTADADSNGNIFYTVYCNQQEFSSLQYGEGIYRAVAAYILQQRLHGERYPCYITDLDLSHCESLMAPQHGLQSSHYLQCKRVIEQALNEALGHL